MSRVEILGFHTCKVTGGAVFLLENAPFISQSSDNQWLTQGYYFWTDSDHFAKIWGRVGYDNQYAILQCNICLDSGLLLDLVGAVTDQQYFQRLASKFKAHLVKVGGNINGLTVNAVIDFYRGESERNPEVFPFLAIKAQDHYEERELIPFTPSATDKMILGITRQQLCVFEGGLATITDKQVIFPETFKKKSDQIIEARNLEGIG